MRDHQKIRVISKIALTETMLTEASLIFMHTLYYLLSQHASKKTSVINSNWMMAKASLQDEIFAA